MTYKIVPELRQLFPTDDDTFKGERRIVKAGDKVMIKLLDGAGHSLVRLKETAADQGRGPSAAAV